MNGCNKEELIIEIVKNIDREAWLQRQNKVLTTMVYALCDGKYQIFRNVRVSSIDILLQIAINLFCIQQFSKPLVYSHKFKASFECGHQDTTWRTLFYQ